MKEIEPKTDNSDQKMDGILIRQKRLNMTFFAVWLMVITTLQWIMVDMYLPALPVLKVDFGCSESLLNVSLNAGLITSAFGTLFGGMLSDKYGRKSMLILGLMMAAVCSLICAMANGIMLLVIMRGIGGLGTGFAMAVTTAMIKDSYYGERFQKTMTVMQSVAVVGPLVAPALGSFLINAWSWRFIFIFLGASTGLSAIPIFISTDTLPRDKRISGNIGALFSEMGNLARDRGFCLFTGIMAFLTIPVWAYIAVSSYVYIDEFGLSNIEYSGFYACGSALSLVAPFVYMLLAKKFKTGKVVSISLGILTFGGLELLFTGSLFPVLFMIGALALMLTEGIIRPLVMVVLLEEHSDTVGSATAIIQFMGNAVGIIGSSIATLGWSSMATGVSLVSIGSVICGAVCWVIIRKNGYLRNSLNQ